MKNVEQHFDPSWQTRRLSGEATASADVLSCEIGHLMAEIEDSDLGTATGHDARLLAIHTALTTERNRLRRLASDLHTVAAIVADALNRRDVA